MRPPPPGASISTSPGRRAAGGGTPPSAAEGARVMLVDRDPAQLEKVAQSFSEPERVATHAADVSQSADTRAYLEATVKRWGSTDGLFSNAGLSGALAPGTAYPAEGVDA